jgi:lauroyl/myristoyl acyltransferase
VVVRRSGLEACKQFRQGCAIRDVKAGLARRNRLAADAVDLRPLLRSLRDADLIASVDHKPLREKCPPSIYSAYRYFLRFHFKQKFLKLAYRSLPVTIGKKLAHCVHRLDLAPILWPKALRAEEHARRSPRTCLSAAARAGFADRYFHHLIANIVDFESVEAMKPAEAEQWLERHLEYEGLEHLDRAKSEGLPVIIAGLHFAATKLLALFLMRRGYDTVQLWMPDGTVDMAAVTAKLEAFRQVRAGYGQLEIVRDFSLSSYKRLLRSLKDGRVMVWFADMFGSRERLPNDTKSQEWRDAATKVFAFGQIQTGLEQSRLDVVLCGQRVFLNPWIGGFARMAGAAVVPAAVIRERGRLRMTLQPVLRLPSNPAAKDVEDLNRALFGRLDSLLRRYPDQWFGWHSLCPVPESGS